MTLCGLILAGGQGRRVAGADKGLLLWQNRPMIATMSDLLRPLCHPLIISCRPEAKKAYAPYADHLIHDTTPGYLGPMVALLSALPWCQQQSCLLLPCDMPLLPATAVQQLMEAANHHPLAPALALRHQGQIQPLVSILRPALLQNLPTAVANGERSLLKLLLSHQLVEVPCSIAGFDNMNHLNSS